MAIRKKQRIIDMMNDSQLEPRVVRLETGLDILTKNVNDIAISMRENAMNLDNKMGELTIAITTAQAPKKTDWSLFVSIGFFIMALASAVFWPLNQQTQNNKETIAQTHNSMVEHIKLDMHPVGLALVNRLEMQIKEHVSTNERELKTHVDRDILEADETRKHFHEELGFVQSLIEAKVAMVGVELKGIQSKNELYFDMLAGKLLNLEGIRTKMNDREYEELMLWKQRLIGVNVPTTGSPLLPKSKE
jgi:hypothetical protein